ncbi:cell division septum initiation protein DivIVA [Microbacterium trichothecenolyticum]|uniref:DivIVA domain-containing protein n=1 Tax=Microbacterium trichothecenolyticum TaxID=69370 RepID=UPI002865C332|nr:DivIVA domain-containing protein [Microbacterium trichothecenolyticum]MDR7110488.1 cell division septum initiation protein DivIVA [Microbacterium trichothecenolyticum]
MTAIQSVSTTPETLRAASFSDERHGYSRGEVDALLTAAADALEVAWRENAALTASGVSADEGEISSRAVLLLSSAQRIADDAVAEAESYARDLIETARKQYREIVERAQQVAHSIEKEAAAHPAQVAAAPAGAPAAGAPAPASASQPGPADRSPALAFATDDLEVAGPASPEDVVRARQFARMASAQVHSLLESIERELGRLGATPARTTPTTPTTPTTAAPLPAPANPSDEGRRRRSDVEY